MSPLPESVVRDALATLLAEVGPRKRDTITAILIHQSGTSVVNGEFHHTPHSMSAMIGETMRFVARSATLSGIVLVIHATEPLSGAELPDRELAHGAFHFLNDTVSVPSEVVAMDSEHWANYQSPESVHAVADLALSNVALKLLVEGRDAVRKPFAPPEPVDQQTRIEFWAKLEQGGPAGNLLHSVMPGPCWDHVVKHGPSEFGADAVMAAMDQDIVEDLVCGVVDPGAATSMGRFNVMFGDAAFPRPASEVLAYRDAALDLVRFCEPGSLPWINTLVFAAYLSWQAGDNVMAHEIVESMDGPVDCAAVRLWMDAGCASGVARHTGRMAD